MPWCHIQNLHVTKYSSNEQTCSWSVHLMKPHWELTGRCGMQHVENLREAFHTSKLLWFSSHSCYCHYISKVNINHVIFLNNVSLKVCSGSSAASISLSHPFVTLEEPFGDLLPSLMFLCHFDQRISFLLENTFSLRHEIYYSKQPNWVVWSSEHFTMMPSCSLESGLLHVQTQCRKIDWGVGNENMTDTVTFGAGLLLDISFVSFMGRAG